MSIRNRTGPLRPGLRTYIQGIPYSNVNISIPRIGRRKALQDCYVVPKVSPFWPFWRSTFEKCQKMFSCTFSIYVRGCVFLYVGSNELKRIPVLERALELRGAVKHLVRARLGRIWLHFSLAASSIFSDNFEKCSQDGCIVSRSSLSQQWL